MKNVEFFKLVGFVLITFVIVWALALVSNIFFGLEINSDTAIISFIGIIATFVVVGNYSQVVEMRNQALEQTRTYNAKIEEFNTKLMEIDTLKGSVETKERDFEKLKVEFYESQIENFILLSIQFLRNENYIAVFDLLKSALILLPKVTYRDYFNELVINNLITCIKKIDNKSFKKVDSETLLETIKELKKEWEVDEKSLKELKELIIIKNV